MATATRHCDECEHFDSTWAATAANVVCKLKHKPRFYVPTALTVHWGATWGWKRRCEDFKEKRNDPR